MSLEELIKKFLGDPEIPAVQKDGLQAILNSHIETGKQLQKEGRHYEAIAEYAREHDRPIHSDIDADIVQASYWFEGRAYREIGELDNAINSLQKARELLITHGIGSSPNGDLAEIYISRGQFDEAIKMCQEVLDRVPDWSAKQLMNKAVELKEEFNKRNKR